MYPLFLEIFSDPLFPGDDRRTFPPFLIRPECVRRTHIVVISKETSAASTVIIFSEFILFMEVVFSFCPSSSLTLSAVEIVFILATLSNFFRMSFFGKQIIIFTLSQTHTTCRLNLALNPRVVGASESCSTLGFLGYFIFFEIRSFARQRDVRLYGLRLKWCVVCPAISANA